MTGKYTKVEELSEAARTRHDHGKMYAEIAFSYGLEKIQLQQFMQRKRRMEKKIAAGYILRPKRRLCKESANEKVKQNNKIVQLRMQAELLRNFCTKLVGGGIEISGD